LLEDLPRIPPDLRAEAAERFLASSALAPDRREDLIEQILTIVSRPDLAPLFAPGSRAEVAIAGNLTRPGGSVLPFSGRIDRLAVTADAIYIADFKTGGFPGAKPPIAYVQQLALYRAALAPLYPTHAIHAFLVWIEADRVTSISAAALDDSLSLLLAGS
jgi:ATP-dependent helicase/nuclease subunit A